MSLDVDWTSQFKKDYKHSEKRGLDIALLDECIRALVSGEPLPAKYRDHSLTGNWAGHRECHVLPDWLLIYRLNAGKTVITLARTGSHSDLY